MTTITTAILISLAAVGGAAIMYTGGTPGAQPSTSTTAASSEDAISGPPAGLALTPSFDDEFNGDAVSPNRWVFALYDPAHEQPTIAKRSLWGNSEQEVYCDPAFLGLGIDPFKVTGGTLTISANPLSQNARAAMLSALDEQPADIRNSKLREVAYSSGLISTRASFSQTYGYFEMRARWSRGKGLWPAFWLLPQSGAWPPEIDAMEAHGDKPTTVFQSTHSKAEDSITRTVTSPGNAQEWHTYGMLWTPRTVDYYIDGRKTASIPTPADMHKPMYLIANLAVGGSWPGYPDADTKFPATMQIDFIRAWRYVGQS